MNGFVDEERRALIAVHVSRDARSTQESLQVWVDTAFNGGLVMPRDRIARLRLKKASSTEAILADGQLVELETYSCVIAWFGATYRTQVVANDGEFPLLGTMLLAGRKLTIDYDKRTVLLE